MTTERSHIDRFQDSVREVIKNRALSYDQRIMALAHLAENALPYPPIPEEARALMSMGVISDLAEGSAPYRPRYILPDYARFLAGGSSFLELPPPSDLDEALNALAILYRSVPSITGFPVYLGDMDTILEPFAAGVSDEDLERKLTLFLRLVDRTCPDGFVHADLGPRETRVGHACLAAERRLKQVVPNWTLKYDPEITSDALLLDAIETSIAVAKPHFVNHPSLTGQLGPDYSVASCYNSLPLGGGSYTLVRLNLRRLVEEALAAGHDATRIVSDDLRVAALAQLAVMEARIRFIVEESGFFESSFLVQEGLVARDRFTAMFGLVGLAEAVSLLLTGNPSPTPPVYGHSHVAMEMATRVLDKLRSVVSETPLPYCEASGGHAQLHAQAGLSDDVGVTPGVRIPPGTEPDLPSHLIWASRLHDYFPSGISDPVHFDFTVRNNPRAVADVIKGAFRSGMREFTFAIAGGEFVRVTGYLVRRTDLARLAEGKVSRYDTTALAVDSLPNQGVDRRAVRRLNAQ